MQMEIRYAALAKKSTWIHHFYIEINLLLKLLLYCVNNCCFGGTQNNVRLEIEHHIVSVGTCLFARQ